MLSPKAPIPSKFFWVLLIFLTNAMPSFAGTNQELSCQQALKRTLKGRTRFDFYRDEEENEDDEIGRLLPRSILPTPEERDPTNFLYDDISMESSEFPKNYKIGKLDFLGPTGQKVFGSEILNSLYGLSSGDHLMVLQDLEKSTYPEENPNRQESFIKRQLNGIKSLLRMEPASGHQAASALEEILGAYSLRPINATMIGFKGESSKELPFHLRYWITALHEPIQVFPSFRRTSEEKILRYGSVNCLLDFDSLFSKPQSTLSEDLTRELQLLSVTPGKEGELIIIASHPEKKFKDFQTLPENEKDLSQISAQGRSDWLVELHRFIDHIEGVTVDQFEFVNGANGIPNILRIKLRRTHKAISVPQIMVTTHQGHKSLFWRQTHA